MRDTARWCFLERGSVLSAFGSSVEAGRDEQRGAEKVKSLPILLARIRVASLPSPPSHCCRCTTVNRPKNNNKTVMTSLILYIYIFFFFHQRQGVAYSLKNVFCFPPLMTIDFAALCASLHESESESISSISSCVKITFHIWHSTEAHFICSTTKQVSAFTAAHDKSLSPGAF